MTSLAWVLRPISLALRIGNRLVIDFGLANLFDRIEKTIGRRLTAALVVLIVVTIAISCIGLIWSNVFPAFQILREIVTGGQVTLNDILDVLFGIMVGVLVVLVGVVFAYTIEFKAGQRNFIDEGREFRDAARGYHEETKETLEKATRFLTDLKKAVKEDRLEDFIKEHEADPDGDLDKLDAVIKRPTQGSGKATPKASSEDASGD